jgi:hypothetical protein
MDAIIPAAGLASRMRGIPKFLLPCDSSYTTLIEMHIENLLPICETIWIPTRPDLVVLLDSLGLAKDRVIILPVSTENMTQTVNRVLKVASATHFQLIMPDTYFHGDKPYQILNSSPSVADLACWEIRPDQIGKLGQVNISTDGIVDDMRDKDPSCIYPHSWGALVFARKLMNFSQASDPHIGYAMKAALLSGETMSANVVNGKYFDCGTPNEYLSMLREIIS